MKNLAGNDVLIFLYRFVLRPNGVSFVLNETIAKDMYPDINEKLQPLLHACSETLVRHRHLCDGETIMDGNILIDECFEVMLSKGLGQHLEVSEKQNLFHDANEVAQLLMEVMDRRSLELEDGTYPGPQAVIPKIEPSQSTNLGLEALGMQKSLLEQPLNFDGKTAGLKRLKPDDLPKGVIAKQGYDHRGVCYAFEHVTLGDLGKVVLISVEGGVQLTAELNKGNSGELPKKKGLLEDIITVLEKGLQTP